MGRRTCAAMALVATLATTTVVATAGPANAAGPPVLDTVSVSTVAVQAPGNVVLSYTATVDSPVSQALAGYTDEAGRLYSVHLTPGSTGSGTLNLPDGVRNGLWTLQYVYLATSGDGNTYVCREGRANTGCTEFRDFSAYDVTVSGSTHDITAPVVTEVRPPATAVRPGEDLTVAWEAVDAHALAQAVFRFRNPAPEARGHSITVASTSSSALASGSLTIAVPASAYDGTYVLDQITIKDTVGNAATYLPSGTVVVSGGATEPTSHGMDFAAVAFTATGSTQDVAPPVLKSFTPSLTALNLGDSVRLGYTAEDATGPLTLISVAYLAPEGGEVVPYASTPASLTGAVDFLPWQAGLHQLSRVVLEDSRRNRVEYRRDGSTYNPLTRATGAHSLDFAAADLRVVPAPVDDLSVRPRPQSVDLGWSVPEHQVRGTSGYKVVVNPGNRVITVTPDASGHHTLRVTGLRNAVTYSFTVTAVGSVGTGPARAVKATPLMSSNVWAVGDVNRDRRNDLLANYFHDGRVRLYRGTGAPGFRSASTVEWLSGGYRTFPGGEVEGNPSYILVGPEQHLEVHSIGADGRPAYEVVHGPGWGMRFIDGSADFTGDRVADIVAVTPGGSAYLYRGYGSGRYGKGTRIATGWGTTQTVFAASDVTGDRRADLLVVDSAGVLWIHPGNGAGRFWTRRKVGSGWGGLGALFSARDVTGDGRVDLGAVTMGGTLRVYKGRGNGTFTGAVSVSSGWAPYL
ncbi:fibronectin type III domain-containing protein [Knoellia sp. 3-2P3]|uniref:fibronectin type III domain-containing protein n=1 Tax=unclassified Knoellia TaxID=2618719 RepID=UPI0023DA046C|nr:fibronectin type III domain-containing protein [Knoellia sp. 3-2P3]MDF2090875.1 fibronectin type III domain-containing protein [Knoellia sp. 3-2P3]